MKPGNALLLVAVALLPGSCGIADPPLVATMSVKPGLMAGEYRLPDGEVFVARPGLSDPRGLAGLEINVYWRRADTLMFGSSDLPSPSFEVPGDGPIWVEAQLRQNDDIVSEGRANWYLDPGAEWTVYVNRLPVPVDSQPQALTGPNPIGCAWRWCHLLWRFELREDVRTHPREALWLLVYREHPDECRHICP